MTKIAADAPALPSGASIDFNKLHDELHAGKPADVALEAAIEIDPRPKLEAAAEAAPAIPETPAVEAAPAAAAKK